MNGYPVHDKCGGLLMSPAEAGLEDLLEGGSVFCARCSPKNGLVRVGRELAKRVAQSAAEAGVKPVARTERPILLGDLRPRERLSLWLVGIGTPDDASKVQLRSLRKRGLVTQIGASWKLTSEGATLARAIGWRVKPSAVAPEAQVST